MTGEKTARRKTSYSLELWDLCGTSYGPFPFDAPLFMQSARKTSSSLSSSGAHIRCYRAQHIAKRSEHAARSLP